MFAASSQSCVTLPVISIVTLERDFGVSIASWFFISSFNFSPYFSTIEKASSEVEASAQAGPEAMESGLSPRMSLKAMQYTFAGEQISANLPPFTPERCLRTVFISTISAPHFSIWSVISRKSANVRAPAGFSNKAEPPPETRKNTVSFSFRSEMASMIFSVPRIVFSSGRGCPASRMVKSGISP